MLQESFDLPSTQILSLYALGRYLDSKPQLTVSQRATAAKAVSRRERTVITFVFDKKTERTCCSSDGSDSETVQVSEERALGASLLTCGLKQDSCIGLSAQLLGNALLGVYLCFCLHRLCLLHLFSSLTIPSHPTCAGKVEMLKGIHTVFKGMPLFWGRGYLGRALDVMETAASRDVRLSRDMVKNGRMFMS